MEIRWSAEEKKNREGKYLGEGKIVSNEKKKGELKALLEVLADLETSPQKAERGRLVSNLIVQWEKLPRPT